MKNLSIAQKLREVADLLEFEGVPFKPQAYRRAALKIENLNFDICEITEIKALIKLPSIGEGIAKKILEICKTGELEYLNQVKQEIEVDLENLEEIEGLGPKKIKKLFEKLNIKTVAELKEAAEKHQIEEIEGFGEVSQEKLLQNIHLVQNRQKRFLYGQIQKDIKILLEKIRQFPETQQAEVAGSFRRHKETIGDIDLLIVTQNAQNLSKKISQLSEIKKIILHGEKKMSFDLENDLRIDIRFVKEASFGSALLYFTGNKEFNIRLRKIAIANNWKLNEYGLYENEKQIAGQTEKEIFDKLGLNFIPPECRENIGEIEIAQKRDFSFLLPEKLPQGDLHLHTRFSDGEATIEEVIKKAITLGHQYIAITDHTGSLAIANPLSEFNFTEYLNQIDSLNQKYPQIKILKGAEVNILANGEIDLEEKWLKKLEFVIASIHTGMNSTDYSKNTQRYLKALDNPYINLIGHPTTRRFNQKEGLNLDYRTVFEKAKEKNVAFEISSTPDRLDLPTNLLAMGKSLGNKFIINTDSHTLSSLDNLWLGVYQARRALLEESDVLNYLELNEFLKWIK